MSGHESHGGGGGGGGGLHVVEVAQEGAKQVVAIPMDYILNFPFAIFYILMGKSFSSSEA